MSNKKNIFDYWPKAMFWDVHPDKLSVRKNKGFIIQRVLSHHMDNPVYLENLEKLYPLEEIKYWAIESPQIFGNDNIQFIADRYGLDVKYFQKWISDLSKYP